MITPKQQIIILALLALVSIVFGPLLSIWALNTLFGLQIEYSLANWFTSGLLIK